MVLAARLDRAELFGGEFLTGTPERFGLGFAASFGHRFRKVGKQHGEPEPQGNGRNEAGRRFSGADQCLDEKKGGNKAADPHDKHDRILDLVAGIQLTARIDHRLPDDRRFKQGASGMIFCETRHGHSSRGARNAPLINRCSTIGPRASAGTNVRAPTMMTTPIRSTTKSGVCVESVPGPAGTIFFRASAPGKRQRGNRQPEA